MKAIYDSVDPAGLLEYSVVYTDRALNHMSHNFRQVMQDISGTLKTAYNAQATAIVPGSGTFGMEAVARQYAQNEKCLVIRNGWFSYRWSQILEAGNFADSVSVLSAAPVELGDEKPFAPADIETVVDTIKREKPAMVFAPHVETSAGMILPDDYIRAMADATHSIGGLLVLDCIASGCQWVDMGATGVDILISAPQKGWSGPPCCGLVMFSGLARERIETTQSNSFAIDLRKWLSIMETYESGAHAYHSTMPTESLRQIRDVMQKTVTFGLKKSMQQQLDIGQRVRTLLEQYGFESVAAKNFQASGVVVSYTKDKAIQDGSKFAKVGMQIAPGVPLMCGESERFQSFRLGLFGLDKLQNADRTVESLESALSQLAL